MAGERADGCRYVRLIQQRGRLPAILQQGEVIVPVQVCQGVGQAKGVLADTGSRVIHQPRVNTDVHPKKWLPT
jgi:hypothetical protein